jgi:mRNA-degrading endonuclease HigB of HigAB toxin-antitoxin module
MSNAFKIKKMFLLGLASWLAEQNLVGRLSRERSRFVQILSAEINKIEEERKAIIEKYVEKEEDGTTWKKTVDNGVERWSIPEEKQAEMQKEYADLMDEDFVLDIGEEHKAKTLTVKDILLNTDYKFGPQGTTNPAEAEAKVRQANDYEKWCEAFESLDL